MKSVIVKLGALSICSCGAPVLHDHIPIGTEYRIYPDSIQRGFIYGCGRCGKVQQDIAVVLAGNRNGEPPAPLPLALFDLVAEVA
ncbi:MAG: hypothetical protein JWO19_4387 [Bryobacterales bacterium]|nr:hypothetical protein [Bryobacterales bacterium]